jgi:predicted small integral membrane protein
MTREVLMDNQNEVINHPVEHSGRKEGFLPLETNWFDRFFIGVMGHVALNLLWMRFLEAYIPLIVATVLGILWIIYVIWKG